MLSKKYTKWVPAMIVMLIIFIFSSVQGSVIVASGFGAESYHISSHSILFFLLCFCFYKALGDIRHAMFYTILYGLFDEFHQKFTLGRSSSLFDVYTDAAGAFVSGLILWKLQPLLPKTLKNWLNN